MPVCRDFANCENPLKTVALLSRVCKLAQTVDFFYTAFGPSQAEEVARNRRARWFDPALVDSFLAKVRAGSVWERMADPDLLRAVSRLTGSWPLPPSGWTSPPAPSPG